MTIPMTPFVKLTSMKTSVILTLIILCCGQIVSGADRDFREQLQSGLFEEEVNRDLDAAIKSYESVLKSFDAQRQHAATAIFRLGECYRKKGMQKEAQLFYSRVAQEFPDQADLVQRSLAYLKQPSGGAPVALATGQRNAALTKLQGELAAVIAELELLEEMPEPKRRAAILGDSSDLVLVQAKLDLHKARNELEIALGTLGPKHPSVSGLERKIMAADGQIRNRAAELLAQLKFRRTLLERQLEVTREFLGEDGKGGEAQTPEAELAKNNNALKGTMAGVQAQLSDVTAQVSLLEKMSKSERLDKLGRLIEENTLQRLQVEYESAQKQLEDASKTYMEKHPTMIALAENVKSLSQTVQDRSELVFEGLKFKKQRLEEQLEILRGYLSASTGGTQVPPVDTAEQAELNRIRILLQNSPDLLNGVPVKGPAPLVEAVKSGYLSVARYLIERGADLHVRAGKETPLQAAIQSGNLAMTRLLVEAGVDLTGGANPGDALYSSVELGYTSIAEALMELGADVNAPGPLETSALQAAVVHKRKGILASLMERKASVKSENQFGERAIHLAINADKPDTNIVAMLLASGADVNAAQGNCRPRPGRGSNRIKRQASGVEHYALSDSVTGRGFVEGSTPLHIACSRGNSDMVDLLMANGADIHAQDKNGATALFVSIWEPVLLKKLLKHGAKIDTRGSSWSSVRSRHTLLTRMMTAKTRPGLIDSIRLLLEHGANPNTNVDYDGHNSLLGYAAKRGYEDYAKLLLEFKARPDSMEHNPAWGEITPLWLALYHGNGTIVAMLAEAGADVNHRIETGSTALHYAIAKGGGGGGGVPMVSALLAAGADPNLMDSEGLTPLDSVNSQLRKTLRADDKKMWLGLQAQLLKAGAKFRTGPTNAITVTRLESGFKTVILSETDHPGARFTVLDVMSLQYRLRVGAPRHNQPLPFPDFAGIKVFRSQGKDKEPIVLGYDALAGMTNDRSAPFVLEWGDVIEIPELPHVVGHGWELSAAHTEALHRRLTRDVVVTFGEEAVSYRLSPIAAPRNRSVSFVVAEMDGKIATNVEAKSDTRVTCFLRELLDGNQKLESIHDLGAVRLLRKDPETGKDKTYVVDLAESVQNLRMPSVARSRRGNPYGGSVDSVGFGKGPWLMDGDRVFVPFRPGAPKGRVNPGAPGGPRR
jgi:ankyrin repeat protein